MSSRPKRSCAPVSFVAAVASDMSSEEEDTSSRGSIENASPVKKTEKVIHSLSDLAADLTVSDSFKEKLAKLKAAKAAAAAAGEQAQPDENKEPSVNQNAGARRQVEDEDADDESDADADFENKPKKKRASSSSAAATQAKQKAISGYITLRVMGIGAKDYQIPLYGRLMEVAELRDAVTRVTGIPAEKQRLVFGGKIMVDKIEGSDKAQTLFKYGLRPESTIQLYQKLDTNSNGGNATADNMEDLKLQVEDEPNVDAATTTTTTTPAAEAPVANYSMKSDAVIVDGVVLCTGRNEHDEPNIIVNAAEDEDIVRRWARVWTLAEPLIPQESTSRSNTTNQDEPSLQEEEVPVVANEEEEFDPATCDVRILIGKAVMVEPEPSGGFFCGDIQSIVDETAAEPVFKVRLTVAGGASREMDLSLADARTAVEECMMIEKEALRKKRKSSSARKTGGAGGSRKLPMVTIEFEHDLAQGYPKSLPKGTVYRVLYAAALPKSKEGEEEESKKDQPKKEKNDDDVDDDEEEDDEDEDHVQDPFSVIDGQKPAKVTSQKISFVVPVFGALPDGRYTVGLVEPLDEGSCWDCRGDERKTQCDTCGCGGCKFKTDPAKMIECDQTGQYFHIYCLGEEMGPHVAVDAETGETILKKTGPLTEEEFADLTSKESVKWFCPEVATNETTIDAVRAGQVVGKENRTKRKAGGGGGSKDDKQAKVRPSDLTDRNWGGGMSCVGRSKTCTIVPANHFGNIPGVPVGTMWEYRVNVSESGVHRPPVSGMHGKEKDGCYSIVLAGGYSDDEDEGDEFLYTGSGGRDLSGNKRCAAQSKDQELTGTNAALARNCNEEDWKLGRPVRVVRASKLSKTNHGKYAPLIPEPWSQSLRYDGLYKVKNYGLVDGKSGFKVVRYCLARDDSESAPWTEVGAKVMAGLGYNLPQRGGGDDDDDDDMDECKSKKKRVKKATSSSSKKSFSKKNFSTSDDDDDVFEDNDDDFEGGSKKRRRSSAPKAKKRAKNDAAILDVAGRKLNGQIRDAIQVDARNADKWTEVFANVDEERLYTEQITLLEAVDSAFRCPITQELSYPPVTLNSGHTMSLGGFKAHVKKCREMGKPSHCVMTREEISAAFASSPVINKQLQAALKLLLPSVCAAATSE